MALGALAVVAIIVVVAIVLGGGDDSNDSAATTSAPSAASTNASTPDPATGTGAGDPQAFDNGSEPFAETLPRATKYASLAISIDRLIVRTQDPASYQSGEAAEPDGPRWAFIEGTVSNPLAHIPISVETTEFTLVLGDGTEVRGGPFGNDPVVAPATMAALNVAFELGDVTDLANSIVKIGDQGDEPATIALDGDPVEPDPDRDVSFEPASVSVADANGNTVDWGLGETSTGLDSYYDGTDLPDGQSTADRRAGAGQRWLNMSVTLTAGTCTCDGLAADTSMIRLVVDGTAISPSNTFAENLAPSTSLEVGVIFEYPATATTATLQIGPADSPALQQSVGVALG